MNTHPLVVNINIILSYLQLSKLYSPLTPTFLHLDPPMADEPKAINPAPPDEPKVVITPLTPEKPTAIIALTDEQSKAVISTSLMSILLWHIWAVISITGIVALLYLNFSHYFVGLQLGVRNNKRDLANILGALQIIAKIHELSSVAIVVAIAEQYVLRDLLGDGFLLGLVGTAGEVANPSFLVSKRFTLAVKFGLRSIYPGTSTPTSPTTRYTVQTLRLVVLLLFCSVIAGLAGPSSAVLMIPRVDWFRSERTYYTFYPQSTIPTILLGTAPVIVNDEAFMESNPFALSEAIIGSGMKYWANATWSKLRNPELGIQERSMHFFYDSMGNTYMNVSGSCHRPLDSVWIGRTMINVEGKFGWDTQQGISSNSTHKDNLSVSKNIKWTYDTSVVTGSITCRAQTKIPCTTDSSIADGLPYLDWCYEIVHSDPTMVGDLRMGRNLLMSLDFEDQQVYPRVWLTEGPESNRTSDLL